jgi:uncharacterized protein DUF6644
MMLDPVSWCEWLQDTSAATSIRESVWIFPAIETLHLFALIAVVGSSALLDIRLLGLGLKSHSVSKLAGRTLPWALWGFAVMCLTGFSLFASGAARYYDNFPLRLKVLMITLAGANALVFHFMSYRSVSAWENDAHTPLAAKAAGLISILLWFGIVIAGRCIAYF